MLACAIASSTGDSTGVIAGGGGKGFSLAEVEFDETDVVGLVLRGPLPADEGSI